MNGAHYTLAGGFVGDIELGASISDSYANGGVFAGGVGFSLFGGFAGEIQTGATVNHVLATGSLGGAGGVGGLVGFMSGGSISNSYWDEGTTGRTNAVCCGVGTQTNLVGVGGGTGISPFLQVSYPALNFVTVWAPPSAGVYPTLQGVGP